MKRIVTLLLSGMMVLPLVAQDPTEQMSTGKPESDERQQAEEAAVMPDTQETQEAPEAVVLPDTPEAQEAPEVAVLPDTPEAQEAPEATVVPETSPRPEKTKVTLGENEVFIIEENGDTTRVMLGSRGISIVEGKEGTQVKVIEMDEDGKPKAEQEGNGEKKKTGSSGRRGKKFRPHYAGLDLGLNNYVTPDFNMSLPQDQLFMDLNTSRSWNVNLNFLEYGLGLGTNKLGLVTGLGFEFTNYVFDNPSSIQKDGNGVIVEYVPLEADNIVKSKFNMTYLTAPLLLEIQIPGGRKSFHISGGIIGGVKIASNTKIKYEVSGQKSKEKAKGDYNLAPLRYGATVRVGYKAINLFANYYLTPLFGEGGGPELYPFSVGLTLVPF